MKFFTPFDSDKAAIAADEEKIAARKRELEEREITAARRNSLLNAVDDAKAKHNVFCLQVDAFGIPRSPEQLAGLIKTGIPLDRLATQLAEAEAVKKIAPALKAAMRKLTVGRAESELADFKSANKKILATIPPPEKMQEPAFKAAPQVNDGAILPTPPSAGVRMMLNLKPGETIAPRPFEVAAPASGGAYHDIDDDD